MNNINMQTLHKIFEAQTKGIAQLTLNDVDGKPIQAKMNTTGWYEGYY